MSEGLGRSEQPLVQMIALSPPGNIQAPAMERDQEMPVPVDLLEHIVFRCFNADLSVTNAAQTLLNLSSDEIKALGSAAARLRERVHGYEVERLQLSERLTSEAKRIVYEIAPDPDLAQRVSLEFRDAIRRVLGERRAGFVEIPLAIPGEYHRVYVVEALAEKTPTWSRGEVKFGDDGTTVTSQRFHGLPSAPEHLVSLIQLLP